MAGRFKNALQQPLRAGLAALALDIALIAALAAAAAYFTWVLAAPRAKASPALVAEARTHESSSLAARRLFGAAAPQAAAGPVRLVGVLAPGRALFTENGKPRAAAVGDSVGGLVVREVHADHVVVSRGGALERLALERRTVVLDAPAGARGDAGR
jgi:general secretion pathway protein C